MTTNEYLEKKIDNLIKAIRKDLITKDAAYYQFAGYLKALEEFDIITKAQQKYFVLELSKVLY